MPLRKSDSVKLSRNGDPVIPARYNDPLSSSICNNGKGYSITPARATDGEIEDDLTQMRKTRSGKTYVKPASSKAILSELDDYGYKGRIIKKPKSKLESNIHNEPPVRAELVNSGQPEDEEARVSIETSDTRGETLNTNDTVNLLIPLEKSDTSKKVIAARAKRTARKARCAGSEQVIETARGAKGSSLVNKAAAKAAPPAIPAGAKNFSVVVYTRASSTGIRKDKSSTAPEAEGPIGDILTGKEDKSSSSFESGDDLKDGNYAPVAPRKRAPRKRAAQNKSVRRKAPAPEEEITGATTTPAEIDTTLTKENVKPAAGTKRRGRRNGNVLESEATAQKEAGPPADPDVDAALTTEKPTPAPLGGYAKRKATVPEAATGPPTFPKVGTTLAEIDNTPEGWRRYFGAHTVKVVTHPDTGLKIDNTKPSAATKSRCVKRKATQLEESNEPAAGPREHKKKRVNTSEVRAAVPQEAGPPAAPEVDSTLTAEKPTPRGEITVPEEQAPPAAVSETPVGAAEAATPATTSAPPVRVRGPRYRIPTEGSRKSTRRKAQHDKLK